MIKSRKVRSQLYLPDNKADIKMLEHGEIEARLTGVGGIQATVLLTKEDAARLTLWLKEQYEQD